MIRMFWIIIGLASYFALIIYLIILLRFILRLIFVSYEEKKFNVTAFKELLTVAFLGNYGGYIVERNRVEDTGKSLITTNKNDKSTSIVFSLLTLFCLAMLIIPNTEFGSENINSLFQKNHYQSYHNASLVVLDDDYSPISPEIVAIAEVEYDEGIRTVGNVYVETVGTYHAYSSDEFAGFGEQFTIWDIDNKSYSIRVLDQKPEFRVVKDFYTNVAGVTFDNNGTSRQDILKQVKSGIKHIWLIRDKINQYDKNAVIVHSYYGRIGYINAELAPYIAKILDNGGIVKATLSEVTGGKDGQYYGCNLHIEVLSQVQ